MQQYYSNAMYALFDEGEQIDQDHNLCRRILFHLVKKTQTPQAAGGMLKALSSTSRDQKLTPLQQALADLQSKVTENKTKAEKITAIYTAIDVIESLSEEITCIFHKFLKDVIFSFFSLISLRVNSFVFPGSPPSRG